MEALSLLAVARRPRYQGNVESVGSGFYGWIRAIMPKWVRLIPRGRQ